MFKKLIPGVGLFLLVASLSATPIACSDPDIVTLQHYIDLGTSGCTIGDKLFFGFFYVRTGAAPSASSIGVTAFSNSDLNQGLRFGPFIVSSPADIGIGYNVMSMAGPTIFKAGLSMAGAGGAGSWAAAVTESACFGMVIISPTSCADSSSPTALLSAFVFPPDSSGADSATFAPVGLLGLFKDITLMPGSGPLAVSFVENDFTQVVPEPATTALVGAGLFVLARVWKRRRRT